MHISKYNPNDFVELSEFHNSALEIGKTYNHLRVTDVVGRHVDEHTVYVLCRCSCGNEKMVSLSRLKRGSPKSCGCQHAPKTGASRKLLSISDEHYKRIVQNVQWQATRNNARTRGLSFDLTVEFIWEMSQRRCKYCKRLPFRKAAVPVQTELILNEYNTIIYTNGLDRVDNTVGYQVDNVVACCRPCNIAKNNMTAEEWWEYRLAMSVATAQDMGPEEFTRLAFGED